MAFGQLQIARLRIAGSREVDVVGAAIPGGGIDHLLPVWSETRGGDPALPKSDAVELRRGGGNQAPAQEIAGAKQDGGSNHCEGGQQPRPPWRGRSFHCRGLDSRRTSNSAERERQVGGRLEALLRILFQ